MHHQCNTGVYLRLDSTKCFYFHREEGRSKAEICEFPPIGFANENWKCHLLLSKKYVKSNSPLIVSVTNSHFSQLLDNLQVLPFSQNHHNHTQCWLGYRVSI